MGVLSGLLALLLLLGCGQDGGGGDSAATASPTAPTPGIATRAVTVLEDDTCYHLGDKRGHGHLPAALLEPLLRPRAPPDLHGHRARDAEPRDPSRRGRGPHRPSGARSA
jgi:hypothetical protein